jgi:hypothetical protein
LAGVPLAGSAVNGLGFGQGLSNWAFCVCEREGESAHGLGLTKVIKRLHMWRSLNKRLQITKFSQHDFKLGVRIADP